MRKRMRVEGIRNAERKPSKQNMNDEINKLDYNASTFT